MKLDRPEVAGAMAQSQPQSQSQSMDGADLRAWLSGSRARDEQRNPVVGFRVATRVPELPALDFQNLSSANEQAAAAAGAWLEPAYLRIERPFLESPDDPLVDVAHLLQALGAGPARSLVARMAASVEATGSFEPFRDVFGTPAEMAERAPEDDLAQLHLPAQDLLADEGAVRSLVAAGFDGAIYGEGGQRHWVVFDERQVRPAIAAGWPYRSEQLPIAPRPSQPRASTPTRVREAVRRVTGMSPQDTHGAAAAGRIVVTTSSAARAVLAAGDGMAAAQALVAGAAGADDDLVELLGERDAVRRRALEQVGDTGAATTWRKPGRTSWMMVLPDPARYGHWRVQSFHPSGLGATESFTQRADALEHVKAAGFTVRDDRALDRLKDSARFERGLLADSLARQLAAGEISTAHMTGRLLVHDRLSGVLSSIAGASAQAACDLHTGAIFLAADRIALGHEEAVLFHELMHKHGMPTLGRAGFGRLLARVKEWRRAQQGSPEHLIYQAADARARRAAGTDRQLYDDELFSYAVEEAVLRGFQPSAQAREGSVEQWLDEVETTLRAVLMRLTQRPREPLGGQHLVDLAYAICQMENPRRAALIRERMGGSFEQLLRQANEAAAGAAQSKGACRPVRLSNQAVGQAFGRLAKDGREELEAVLFNWNGAELSEDAERIVLYPGRDGRFVRGREGGTVTVSKREFLEWLAGPGPFDPETYGAQIGQDDQWRAQVQRLRELAFPGDQVRRSAGQDAGDQHYLRWKEIEGELQRAYPVRLQLEPRFTPGRVEIWSIDAKQPGSGEGSDLLRELVRLADAQDVTLSLLVDAGAKEERLTRWYASFGFVQLGEGRMERAPGAAVTRPLWKGAAFKRWFGKSAIVGQDGAPAFGYHGTHAAFTTFRPSTFGAQGPGIYMTDEPAGYGSRTMQLFVRMENPYWFYPSDESLEAEVNGELIEQVLGPQEAARLFERMTEHGIEAYGTEVQDALRARGHDGIVMVYPFGEPVIRGASGSAVLIAFDADQVKSADNIGAFSLVDADIRASEPAGAPAQDPRMDIPAVAAGGAQQQLLPAQAYLPRRLAAAVTAAAGSPAFRDWFEDSAALDGGGWPLPVFHGTTRSFARFSPAKLGEKTGALDARTGFFFAENPRAAEQFTWEDGEQTGGNLMPVFLRITRPLVVRDIVLDGSRGTQIGLLMARAKALGHDGVIFERSDLLGHGGRCFAVFSPDQIKSVTGNLGRYSRRSSDIRLSVPDSEVPVQAHQEGELFFSGLEQVVAERGPRRAPAVDWIGFLRSQAGITPAELDWSGALDWLANRTGLVRREQLLGYLHEHAVRIEEVVYGGGASGADHRIEDLLVRLDALGFTARIQGEGIGHIERRSDRRVFWPESGQEFRSEDAAQELLVGAPLALARELDDLVNAANPDTDDRQSDGTHYANWTLPGGRRYREVLLTLPAAGHHRRRTGVPFADNEIGVYQSPHWRAPNVLLHLRVTDREDVQGRRTLFVEEIQSDWAQEGRRQGFELADFQQRQLTPGSPEAIAALATGAVGDMAVVVDNGFGQPMTQVLRPARPQPLIAPAPFVASSNAWLNLALKRILLIAAQEGYEQVAFISGHQSADRYGQRHQITALSWQRNAAGELSVGVRRKGAATFTHLANLEDGKLADMLGQDLAEQMVGTDAGQISGLDRTIGGHGLVAFYDRLVPQAACKLLEQLGGGPLAPVRLQFGHQYVVQDDQGHRNTFNDRDYAFVHAQEEGGQVQAVELGECDQVGFAVTPYLRDAVLAGLPLFGSPRAGRGRSVAQSSAQRPAQRAQSARSSAPPGAPFIAQNAAQGSAQSAQSANASAPAHTPSIAQSVAQRASKSRRRWFKPRASDEVQGYDGPRPAGVEMFGGGLLPHKSVAWLEVVSVQHPGRGNGSAAVAAFEAWAAARGATHVFAEALPASLGFWSRMGYEVAGRPQPNLRVPIRKALARAQQPFIAQIDAIERIARTRVVDQNGRPLLMYHGTKGDFEEFDPKMFGASDAGVAGKGFYCTYNPEEASAYALNGQFGKGEHPNVRPVYVLLTNPFVITQGRLPDGRHIHEVHQGTVITSKGGAAIRRLAEDGGHDGIVFVRSDGRVGHAVAWRPDQILSAIGYAGAFEHSAAGVRHSLGGVRPLRETSPADRLAALGYSVQRGYEDEPGWIEHQNGTQYDWNEKAFRFEDEDGNPLPREAAELAQFIGNVIDGHEDPLAAGEAANDRHADPFAPVGARPAPFIAQSIAPGAGRRTKVVDPVSGELLRVFHGTGAFFSEFDPLRAGSASQHPTAQLGIFFSASPQVASGFVPMQWDMTVWPYQVHPAQGANVMPAYLDIRNPYVMPVQEFRALVRERAGAQHVRALRERLQAEGFDGIHIPGEPELQDSMAGDEWSADTWIAFGAHQIASAFGLSEGPSSPEGWRMSVPARAAWARLPRDAATREWFADSRVRRPVFHATCADFDRFDTSRGDLGTHFGSLEQAMHISRERMSVGKESLDGARIIPAWIRLANPLRLKDTGSFHADGIAVQLERLGLLPKGEGARIARECDRDTRQRKVYDPLLRELIQRAGFDGVVYANQHEGKGDSYIVFEPKQIRTALDAWQPAAPSPLLRPQSEGTAIDPHDFSQDPAFHHLFYGTPSPQQIARFASWLRERPHAFVRLYHGTAARNRVLDEGLLPATARRRNSLQSAAGYVCASVYAGHARQFGVMASLNCGPDAQGSRVAVYPVVLTVGRLCADLDQLRNRRAGGLECGNSLAESLVHGHGARVRGRVEPFALRAPRLWKSTRADEHDEQDRTLDRERATA